jgi:hypothetical protein
VGREHALGCFNDLSKEGEGQRRDKAELPHGLRPREMLAALGAVPDWLGSHQCPHASSNQVD